MLTYRCYLQTRTDQKEELEKTLGEYASLKMRFGNNRSIHASEEFCKMWQANKGKDYDAYDLHLEKAFQHVSNSDSAVLRYWISYTFASLTNAIGRYNDSIEASRLALDIALANRDRYREADVRAILALSEAELGYYEDALINNQQAIDWNLSKDYKRMVLELYQNRGYMLIGKNDLSAASNVFEKAIHLAVTIDAQYAIFSMHSNLAAIEQRKGNYKESNRLAGRSLKYATENNDENLVAHANSIIAVNLVHLDKYNEAKQAFEQAQNYFKKHELKKNLASNYGGWSDALARVGKYKEAYDAQAKYSALNEELFNSERESRMQRFKSLYKSAEKDREIQRLRESNRIKSIEVANSLLEKRVYWLSGIVGLLIIVLLFVMYRRVLVKNVNLEDRNTKLDEQRYQDRLTRTFNRRYLDKKLKPALKLDEDSSYTFLLLDIDHFKQVNDTWGHLVGDEVLVEFSKRLKQSIRGEDNLIRLGGEEFLIIVKSHSNDDDSMVARKLLDNISKLKFSTSGGELEISMSVGLVRTSPKRTSQIIDYAIEYADRALYHAKASGRNQAAYVQPDFSAETDFHELLKASVESIVTTIKGQ